MVCSWWEARTYTTKQLKAMAIPHSFLWFSASLTFCSSFPISHSCNEGVVALEKSAELWRQTAFASPFLITNSWRPARNCLPAGQAALPTVWNGWCWPSFPAVGMPTGPSSVPRRLQVRQACWTDAAPWWLSLMPLVHRKKQLRSLGERGRPGFKLVLYPTWSRVWNPSLSSEHADFWRHFSIPPFPTVLAPAACRGLAHRAERRL